jgi:hypothetical protein
MDPLAFLGGYLFAWAGAGFVASARGRTSVRYRAGARYGRPPARLTVPRDGRWYLVADLHGYSANAEATVELVSEDGARRRDTDKEALVEPR